jgi:hypothetical protein
MRKRMTMRVVVTVEERRKRQVQEEGKKKKKKKKKKNTMFHLRYGTCVGYEKRVRSFAVLFYFTAF